MSWGRWWWRRSSPRPRRGHLPGAGRWAPRAAGALLAAAGAYVAYYGWWELRVLAGGNPDDPVIDAAAQLQQQLAGLVDSIGPLGWLTAGALLLLAVFVARRRVRVTRSDPVTGERAGR